MNALIDWVASHPDGMTADEYEALSVEESRRIEIVDGAIHVSPTPRRSHQTVARHLANALEKFAQHPFEVDTNADLRLRDVPLRVRRPDVVVYDAKAMGEDHLRPRHCLLVAEVMSAGSVATDQVYKPADYAAAGISHYWRVEDIDAAQRTMTVHRYRLDPATRTYMLIGKDAGRLTVHEPVELSIELADLY